jgi:hypothetical protein
LTVYRLLLPYSRPPLTSNEARSRHHWSTQRAAKVEVQRAVWALAKQARIPRLELCTVCLTWYPPDRRRRDGGSLWPMMKAAVDGLVSAGVLEDDDSQHVAGELCRIGAPSQPARIELAIADRGGAQGLRELSA